MSMNRIRWARLVLALAIVASALLVGPGPTPSAAAPAAQASFASPEQAADALAAAARKNDLPALLKILGPDARGFVTSGDPVADKEARARFATRYDQAHHIDKQDGDGATLVIGKEDYPTPIPLRLKDGRWVFDSKAGAAEILARRIGANELYAVEVCRAFVAAERAYASKDRVAPGIREYAGRFRSSPGAHDGLYWAATPDEEESPLGPLVASAEGEGYGHHPAGKREPYHGYYYRILTAQGKDAPGGAYSYLANGHMIGGFALLAYPARYGDSGVMSFVVGEDGKVYEKNFGPDTARIAARIALYDPDSSWKPAP
jgi:hypothetical protein